MRVSILRQQNIVTFSPERMLHKEYGLKGSIKKNRWRQDELFGDKPPVLRNSVPDSELVQLEGNRHSERAWARKLKNLHC
jgi:hypothetical protein